jgi:hypothetical protein
LSRAARRRNQATMSDRVFFALTFGAAAVMIAVAVVWP